MYMQLKTILRKLLSGAFYDLSNAEEMVLSLTEEAVYFNTLETCHKLFLIWSIEEIYQKAWHRESLVWSYGIEAIRIFNY